MRTAAGCAAFGLLTLVVSAAPAQAKLSRPVITPLAGGGHRVTNPGPTAWSGMSGWRLVLERTVQPPEGAPGMLERPRFALLAPAGQVITLDPQGPVIRLYDRNGRFLRTLGRAGEGPGEFRQPMLAMIHDTLVIYDPSLRRLNEMTLGGDLIRSIATSANDYFPIFFDDHGRYAVRYSTRRPGVVDAKWVWFDRGGQPVDSLIVPPRKDSRSWSYTRGPEGAGEWPIPFGLVNYLDLLPNGTAVYGSTDQYQFAVTRTGVDTMLVFGRSDPPLVAIPGALRDSAFHATVDRRDWVRAVAKESDLPHNYLPWVSLQHDERSNIWIGARTPDAGTSRFDVFSPDGRFLGSVSAPFPVSAFVSFSAGHLTVIDADEDDLPRIRIFRIDRSRP